MGGIEQIEEILKAPSSLPVVPQYERQCQDHKPLDGKAALPVQHLITVLCDAEEEIDNGEGLFPIIQKIHGDAENDKQQPVFI